MARSCFRSSVLALTASATFSISLLSPGARNLVIVHTGVIAVPPIWIASNHGLISQPRAPIPMPPRPIWSWLHAENPLVETLGEKEFGHAPFRCRPVGRDEEDDQLAALRRALQLGLPFLTGLQPAFGIEVEVKPRTRTIEAPPAGSIRKKDRGKPSPVPSLSSVALALALWPEHGKILKKLMRELIDPQLATRLQACS